MGPSMFHHAVAVVGLRADAEDVVQGVFGKLLSMGARLLAVYRPRSYLHRMVHNRGFDRLRERARVVVTDDDVGLFVTSTADPVERVAVAEAVARLKPAQREVVLLHAISGMTFREIARCLAIPEATASSRYRLALEKMRAILEREGQR